MKGLPGWTPVFALLLAACGQAVVPVVERLENLGSRVSLEAANAELARAGRMKDEFLASMSHELRTPLGAILGMATLLQEEAPGTLAPDALRHVELIESASHNLLALINGVLDIARIDAGKVQARLEPCLLSDAGDISVRQIGRVAREKQQQVSLSVEPSGLVVETDGQLLMKLLRCLLSTAPRKRGSEFASRKKPPLL